MAWFKEKCVRLDLGYLGFDKVYDCLQVVLPEKRKKGQKLSDEAKAENKKKIPRANICGAQHWGA